MKSDFSPDYYEKIKERLYSAVISDVLDSMGYRNQTLIPSIRPISRDMSITGRARTVQAADVHREPEHPYKKQLEVLDSIHPGDVFIGDVGGSARSAFFGELMAAAVKVSGGRGAVIDGYARDAARLLKQDFPLFTRGFRPTDSYARNEVLDYDVLIKCGEVTIHPGDLVFGDIDGVVIVPSFLEKEVIKKAIEKVEGENLVRDKILEGMKVSEVFEKYGIL
ncbi:RraA family protein [Salibacterium aidingense]|uniref:RraA family protein n=1 Tax=Salibacterium aidingense TaxID=384933 RepID=UPI003BBF0A58